MSEREIAEASLLLMAEFPDMQQSVIVQALRETASLGECDIPAARRALYAMDAQQQVAQQQQQQRAQGPAAAPQAAEPDEGDSWSWASWNQGMRDLGLEGLGAQLSLLGRQVASALDSVLPAELNPFGFDDDELEEEAARAEAKAALDAAREADTAALVATGNKLQSRRHPGGGGGAGGRGRLPEDWAGEEGEEEDDDKLN